MPLIEINDTEGKVVQIKNATAGLQTTEDPGKTLRKKLKEIEALKDAGILPPSLVYTDNLVKTSFIDRNGNTNDSYCIGISFPCGNYQRYIKTTGNGCGSSVGDANNKKEAINNIEVISGICLYGAEKFTLKTAKGTLICLTDLTSCIDEKIEDISVDKSFSIYEVDAIIGLSSFINTLFRWNENINKVHIEIPRGQYYLYLAEAFEKGWILPDIFSKCMTEIDNRHDAIFHAFKKRLNVKNTSKAEPLFLIEQYFRKIIDEGDNICIHKAKEILLQDEIWIKILSTHEIQNWKDLSNLSNIYVFLKYGKKEPNKILLQIDDPIEEKIQFKTSKLIKKIGEESNYRIWGIYPLQEIFIDPIHHYDSDLYYCSNIKMSISLTKRIIGRYRNEIRCLKSCGKLTMHSELDSCILTEQPVA
ncbi:MAG: hypothetical protein ACXV8Q_08760 [Methylobacter sp.]